jgi:hypothetical protein
VASSSAGGRLPIWPWSRRWFTWYQRARTGGLVHLDLTQSEQLDLLRRYGPFTTDASVWVHGDPTPVIETGDSFGDLPRFTYRLDQAELDHVRALLSEVGLTSSTLVPDDYARPGPSQAQSRQGEVGSGGRSNRPSFECRPQVAQAMSEPHEGLA